MLDFKNGVLCSDLDLPLNGFWRGSLQVRSAFSAIGLDLENSVDMLGKNGIQLNSHHFDYDASVSFEKQLNDTNPYQLSLTITLRRKILRSIIEVIAPPTMLVFISWVNLHPQFGKILKSVCLIQLL